MCCYPSYSVAIRTLGTAGDKYQETLNSIARQTVKPENIFVYIPRGYDLPNETIGLEKYIRCDKGMVTQRSLPFHEITSEFILFLDDDLSFKEDFVEILFLGLISMGGDCICPDIYSVQDNKFIIKLRDFFGGTVPHHYKDWSFRVRLDGHYSYNNNPQSDVLMSQSGAGACMLCRKSAYNAIHFEDERWMDQFHFGLGEDQLFYYKLYKYGFKVLVAYNANIVHLDAGSGHDKSIIKQYQAIGFCRYMIWYRTIYSEKDGIIWKLKCRLAILLSRIRMIPLDIAVMIKYHSWVFLQAYSEGVRRAKAYIMTEDYQKVPSYYACK